MAKTITDSPDISVLDFLVLYNISTATPTITLTNQSTGSNLAGCTWWVQILSPSNTPIHQGSEGTPDETGVWTTFTPSDPWPQPFNQIEFNGVNPYSTTLFVKDSIGNIYSLTKTAIICRPNGNDNASIGNFGQAIFNMTFQWQTAQLYAEDNTNYYYEKQAGSVVSRTWVLDYPRDENNNLPDPVTITGTPFALFPLGVTGDGYGLYLSTIMLYTVGDGSTVKIAYKNNKIFPVWYGLDMCSLMCEIDKVYASAEMTESAILNPLAQQKLLKINTLLQKCWMGILQPLCGIDVPAIVKQIEDLGCIKCNWVKGINGSNPAGAINIIKGTMCGDINMTITQVGNNYTINASDWKYIIKICDDAPTDAFTFTLDTASDNCTRTYCLNVDLAVLKADLGINNIILPVYLHSTTTNPTGCPTSYFPAKVYNVADTVVIGIARSADDLVGILNADATWLAKGTAFNMGNCKVGFYLSTGQSSPVSVHVDTNVTTVGCTNNTKIYDVGLTNFCDLATPITIFFPLAGAYVSYDNGATIYPIGNVTDYNDLVTKLQAESHRPGNITFSAIPTINPNAVYVSIYDANCANNNTVKLYGDEDVKVVYGANAHESVVNVGEITIARPSTMTRLGKICGYSTADYPWHIIRKGNILITCLTNTGVVLAYDISNPLYPAPSGFAALPTVPITGSPVNTPFSGIPSYGGGIPSHWDVYAPTDANNVIGQFVYFMESTSGVIWALDTFTGLVANSFYDVRLEGQCPRYINTVTNKLYFTWDGDRSTLTGSANATNKRDITILDLDTFGSGGISVVQVAAAGDSPWAASYSLKTGNLWITTVKGALIQYNMSSDTVTATHVNAFVDGGVSPFISLLNTNIIIAPDGSELIFASNNGTGSFIVNLGNIGAGSTVFTAMSPANLLHHNVMNMPGSCYLLLLFNANGNVKGGMAKYNFDGVFQGLLDITAGDYFNGLVVDNVPTTTPNGLCS